MSANISQTILLYLVMPLWLAAGIADWFCHRAASIERTTGPKESLIHLLMFVEVGVPLLACLFLEINAAVIALALVAFFIHEVTALWDVGYSVTGREVTPIEQQVHSFLEMIPLMGIVTICGMHWEQFGALFGQGPQAASFSLHWKSATLPMPYIATILSAIFFLELLPYLEELMRGLRVRYAWERSLQH